MTALMLPQKPGFFWTKLVNKARLHVDERHILGLLNPKGNNGRKMAASILLKLNPSATNKGSFKAQEEASVTCGYALADSQQVF